MWGGLRGVFCPWRERAGGGAFGRGPVRATPATPVCGLLRREGVARRRQKPCVVARGELSFPPFFGDPKKGGAGAAGARSPPGFKAWGFPAFCVANRGKTYMNGAALLGRALAPLGTAPTEIAIASLDN